MKHYLVKLTVYIGEYEKTTHSLVSAENEDSAETLAMVNECHTTPRFEDGRCHDGWDFIYESWSVMEVSDEDYEVLKKYM